MSLFHTKTTITKNKVRGGQVVTDSKTHTRAGVARKSPTWDKQPKTFARADANPAIIKKVGKELRLMGGKAGAGNLIARRQLLSDTPKKVQEGIEYLTRVAHTKGYKVVSLPKSGNESA